MGNGRHDADNLLDMPCFQGGNTRVPDAVLEVIETPMRLQGGPRQSHLSRLLKDRPCFAIKEAAFLLKVEIGAIRYQEINEERLS